MTSNPRSFSIHGKGLVLSTRSDIEPHLSELISSADVEEARFQGNTLGVEACEALAKVLSTKTTLRVSFLVPSCLARMY